MITRLKATFPVTFLCSRLGVSRSGYYEAAAASAGPRSIRHGEVTVEVIAAFAASLHVDGYRKVTARLGRKGIHVNRKTVNNIMTGLGLISPQAARQFRVTRLRARPSSDPTDLLRRNFSSIDVGRVLVGDITYVATGEGWLYVATVIDLASRSVLGYATGSRQTTRLIVRALRAARATGLVPTGAIFHSDHGSQYRSKKFIKECGKGILRSMGAKFECWDNAVAETFFSKLKTERLDWIDFKTRRAAKAEVDSYIAHFNTNRLHQSLGYKTPAERIEELQLAA
jgi:transposase InsO family protein